MDRLTVPVLPDSEQMKTIFGRLVVSLAHKSIKLNLSCKDVGHPWNESCWASASILAAQSFRQNINIYGSLYLISALLRGRPLKYYLTRLPSETIRSSVFLSSNCFGFLIMFCAARRFFGHISYWGTLLFIAPACLASIFIERKQRRGLLALYLTNLATETAFNMLVDRKIISSMPNGEVLLFAFASAVYAFLFKMRLLDGSTFNLLKLFVGNSEVPEKDHHLKPERKSRVVVYCGLVTEIVNNSLTILNRHINAATHHNGHTPFLVQMLRNLETKLDKFLNTLNGSHSKSRHRLCTHRYNCLTYSIMGFIQRFIAGYVMQALVKLVGSLGAIVKKPRLIVKILASPVNRELGLFLGSYVFIFRAASCLLRWLTNSNSRLNGLLVGFLSGWSMVFYKSSSIAMYLSFKLLEIVWMIGVKNNRLPLFKSFDVVLYTISTAFILWIGLFEPHNIRAAYWRFLIKVSNNKFGLVNRELLDVFGTKASLITRKAVKTVALKK